MLTIADDNGQVLDRTRSLKKGVMAASLDELLEKSRTKLGYETDRQLLAVLEEDGTEVEEDDYFQTLENNTTLMLLYAGERWSPFSSPDAVDSTGGAGDNMVCCQLFQFSFDHLWLYF